MSYNNNFTPFSNAGNGQRGGYNYPQKKPYYNQGGRGYNQMQPPPKKSGATYSKYRKGKFEGLPFVYAWNASKNRGLITCTVKPYHKSLDGKAQVIVTSEKGNNYHPMIAIVKYERSGVEKVIPVLMNERTKVISIDDLGMVITPNGQGFTKSGKRVTGYFGKYTRS